MEIIIIIVIVAAIAAAVSRAIKRGRVDSKSRPWIMEGDEEGEQ